MAVSDPVSGQTMLIGTTRQVDGQHAVVDVGRAAPGYVMLPTWLGLALETSSDEIDLKVSLSGYTLAIADRAATNALAPARVENQFGIPIAQTAALVQTAEFADRQCCRRTRTRPRTGSRCGGTDDARARHVGRSRGTAHLGGDR